MTLERFYENEFDGWLWARVYGEPDWDEKRGLYTSQDSVMDDDYTVHRWHRYPDPRTSNEKETK
jgi:hypothetical protein